MAKVQNIDIDQGANTIIDLIVYDTSGNLEDLTAYTPSAAFRRHQESTNSVAFTSVGYANGTLRLSLTAEETSNVAYGRYIYNVFLTHNTSNVTSKTQTGVLTINYKV
jgi:hypothetical protein